MAYFAVRVQFQEAYYDADSARLHYEMAQEGFVRLSAAHGEETTYHLPAPRHNLYDEDDDDATIRVFDTARRAAARTGKRFSVLVTKGDGKREWYNVLEFVKK